MKTSDIVPISLSRRELYELVWSATIPEAAARLGISRSWLTKICQRADVPYPSRTYWALVASGKPPARARLSAGGKREEVIILRPRTRQGGAEADHAGGEAYDVVDIPDRLARLHPVLTYWRASMWREQEQQRREPWRKPRDLTAALSRRRMRLLDAVLKGVERRGHRVESRPASPGVLAVLIDAQEVEFVFREEALARPVEGVDPAAPGKRWLVSSPATALVLEAHVGAEGGRLLSWMDAPAAELEDQIAEMLGELSRALDPAAGGAAALADSGRGAVARDLDERRWLALRAIAAQWDSANSVRRLLGAVELAAGDEPLTPEQAAWLDWAQGWLRQTDVRAMDLGELIAATDALAATPEEAAEPAAAANRRDGFG